MKAQDRESAKGIHARDLALKEKLEQQKTAMMSKHYDELSKYYAKLGAAAVSKSGGGEGPVDKRQKEFLESVTKPLIDNLHKQLELAGPDEKEAIHEKIDQVVAEARGVANIGAPETSSPGQIKDPYRKLLNPAVTGGR